MEAVTLALAGSGTALATGLGALPVPHLGELPEDEAPRSLRAGKGSVGEVAPEAFRRPGLPLAIAGTAIGGLLMIALAAVLGV